MELNIPKFQKKKFFYQNSLEGLSNLLNNHQYSDVLFEIKINGVNKQFYAHKCILIARSSYFRKLFSQNNNINEMIIITLENIQPNSLFMILEFIYTDKIRNFSSLDIFQIQEILYLAREYHLYLLEYYIVSKFDIKDNNYKNKSSIQTGDKLLTLWDHLENLYLNIQSDNIFCDITLVTEKKIFKAHKVIISSRCFYFESLFKWNWKESKQNEIIIHEIESDNLQILLKFIYCNKLEISSLEEANELYKLSLFFNIESMGSICEQYIIDKTILPETVCQIWNYAKEIQAEVLNENCKKFFIDNFLICSKTSGFLSLDKDLLKSALNSGEIDEHNDIIFHAIMKWVQENYKKYNCSIENLLLEMLPPSTLFNQKIKYYILQTQKDSILDYLGF